MTYPQQYPAPKPPRAPWKTWQKAIVITLFTLIGILCCGGIFSKAFEAKDSSGSAPIATVTDAGQQTAAAVRSAAPKPKSHTLTAKDITLSVKTTKKSCFGSAGCNVEWQIKAGLAPGVKAQDCEVGYDVRGLEDTQSSTLDFHSDGTYDQDSWAVGSTSSSSKKLTVVVTSVDCS